MRFVKNKELMVYFMFSLLFLCFPYLIIASNTIFSVTSVILFILFIFGVSKINFQIIDKIKERNILLVIFLVTLLTRVILVLMLNDDIKQVSDFGNAFNRAQSMDFSTDYHRVFYHWILYPVLNNFLFNLFGFSQLTALIFNSIVVSLMPCFIYLITKKIFNNSKVSILAAIIYIIWPSISLYTVIFTPDHISSLLLLLGLYLFLNINDNIKKPSNKNIIWSIILGFVLGMSVYFKNFAPVFIISFVIIFIVTLLKKFEISVLKKMMMILVITFGSFYLTQQSTFMLLDNIVGQEVGRNSSIIYLNVGLNSEGSGHYNSKLYGDYFVVLKDTDYNFSETNHLILKELIFDIKNNVKRIPRLVKNKTLTNFSNDNDKLSWVSNSLKDSGAENKINIINTHLKPITNNFYSILIFLMGIVLIHNLFIKNEKILLVYIILFGVVLLLGLVEAQGRYRYAIEPLFCVIGAIGIYHIVSILKSIRTQLPNKNDKLLSKE